MRTLANDAIISLLQLGLLYVSREEQTRKRVRKKKPGEEREKGRGEVFRLVSSQPSHVFNGGRVKIAGKLGSAPVCLACIAGVKRRQRKERKDTELER